MTPDEINGLWQQSQDDAKGISLGFTTQHHYFAALVAAAERNRLAAWMIKRGYSTGHGDTIEDMLKELDWQIRESERKTCATDAEWCVQNHLEHLIPERIKARGELK